MNNSLYTYSFMDEAKYEHPSGYRRFQCFWCGSGNGKWATVLVDTFRDVTPVNIFGKSVAFRILKTVHQSTIDKQQELQELADNMNFVWSVQHYINMH